ncbi:rhomboid family intramembrane serine protease [Lacinutrix neustonica]|uniref:Rhomboid family intramembrane serine protease n=1 Tax=Lacinutrix neustonica TaxID=2980107 RepID=A0A9E8MYM3_9FLAO|nr:rhomboid family intramembrane serine protease [Lacinutrix neustonica]WAC03294.1 rhomboid family intramembrane serine protease [Lacinutrix neustonica]
MIKITETVKHLLILNVILFVGTLIGSNDFLYKWLALYFPANDLFKPWQIVSHMFMHGGFMHLLFNMFALWMFGSAVEQSLGAKRFLILYFAAGLGAVLFQLGYHYFNYSHLLSELQASGISFDRIMDIMNTGQWNFQTNPLQEEQINSVYQTYNASMVGASGCIMGILVAFGMLNPNAELMLIFLPIPIKAKYFIPGIILLDVISALTGQSFFSPSNTAYMAHVGGAFVGFVIMYFWKKNLRSKYRID